MLGNRGSRSFFAEAQVTEMGNHTNKWLQTVSVQYSQETGKRACVLKDHFTLKLCMGKTSPFSVTYHFLRPVGVSKEVFV